MELQDRIPGIDVVLAVFHRVSTNGEVEVFLQRRNASEWEFPGGKVEPGEELKVALIREIKEEIDVVVTSRSLDFMDTFEFCYPKVKVFLHCFLIACDAQIKDFSTWFKLDDVLQEKISIIEGSKKIILALSKKLYA